MTCNEALSALNAAGFICNVNSKGIFARYFGKGPVCFFNADRNGSYNASEIKYACNSH